MKIKNVVILGGGTAGWLAANHLGSELAADDVQITLIESVDVPSIGVGEGTVPYIKKGLARFGISEAELLLECDATFKQGIKFVNWMDSKLQDNNFYYHPFDAPYPNGIDVSPYWVSKVSNTSFGNVGIQSKICELGLSPKKISSSEYVGDLSYAYHFNALKFANLLARNAKERFGVKYVQETIVGANKNEDGTISALLTECGKELFFDFYVDCSGFSSVLIDGVLEVPFVSKENELLTDTALVQQVLISDKESINPYTTATAHKAGWIWDIPLTNRRGTGFVYSSAHMGHEEALGLYAEYLGVDVIGFTPRKIPMKVGYRKDFWCKNCVALGLAQGFVEPLEATSILLADFSAELLARNFPKELTDLDVLQPYYNQVVTYAWDRVVDFIKLHYCISDRVDSSFWVDNKDPKTFSNTLKERLEMWKLRPPKKSDFFSRFDIFDAENYLYVLYGMKYETRAMALTPGEIRRSKELIEDNARLVGNAADELLPHREWLDGLMAAVKG